MFAQALSKQPLGAYAIETIALLKATMQTTCLVRYCFVLPRFVRYKLYPFLALVQFSVKWFSVSGLDRIRAENAWMISLSKLDMANICELINDLLW